MKAHSVWLLREIIERGVVCITNAGGASWPMEISLSTFRGLEKRGYIEEYRVHFWRATDLGKTSEKMWPKVEVPVTKHGVARAVFVEGQSG